MKSGAQTFVFSVLTLAGIAICPRPAAANCVTPASNEIVLYDNDNYGGGCFALANVPMAGINSNDADPSRYFPNDAISSLKVGSAQNLTIFEHINGGGMSRLISAGTEIRCLRYTTGRGWCTGGWVTESWNDKISSLRPF